MEDLNIGEPLPTKDSQLHDNMTSQGEINSTKTSGIEDVPGSEDSKTSLAENSDQEEKPAVHRTMENGTNILDSSDRTEISETSSEKLNELTTTEQPATETPKLNSLEPEEQEKALDNNVEKEENSASAKTSLNTHQTESELSQSLAESNSSSKDYQEGSAADHESGSHRSPDRKSKAEYRKIKSEVTGEGETSESEGEEKDLDTDQSQDTWMDILGNGLLKKRVINTCKNYKHNYNHEQT